MSLCELEEREATMGEAMAVGRWVRGCGVVSPARTGRTWPANGRACGDRPPALPAVFWAQVAGDP